jgi:hypothetical protein
MRWKDGDFNNLRKHGKEIGQTARNVAQLGPSRSPKIHSASVVSRKALTVFVAYRAGGCCENFSPAPTSMFWSPK